MIFICEDEDGAEAHSIIVKMDDGYICEYVHIQKDSVIVKLNERVQRGQIICASGDVGFCAQPHLHLQVQTTQADDAPTIPFAFCDEQGKAYVPIAGRWYNSAGIVKVPSQTDKKSKRKKKKKKKKKR